MTDREKIVNAFVLCRVNEGCSTNCPYWNDDASVKKCTKKLATDVYSLLKEQEAEARLLTAEEVQNMEAGTAFGIETYYDHDGERMPGCAWALRTERLILSYFGTMFPDTVTKIPYNTLEENQNTGKHEKHQYRFWSKKPTFEQCKAVKWND